jgi:hypothetical protein
MKKRERGRVEEVKRKGRRKGERVKKKERIERRGKGRKEEKSEGLRWRVRDSGKK